MRRSVYTALMVLIPTGPVAALSCLPHDAAATYQRLDTADEVYIAVHGTLDFDSSRLPQTDLANQRATPTETRIPARLHGHALSRAGFTQPFDAAITLRVLCFGPWCAQPPAGADVMAFVQKDAGDHIVTINPCGGDAFFAPNPETVKTAQDCFVDGPCDPDHANPE